MKTRTVEQAFNRWWNRNGPKETYGLSDETMEVARSYARIAWSNGYRLGQRREKEKKWLR